MSSTVEGQSLEIDPTHISAQAIKINNYSPKNKGLCDKLLQDNSWFRNRTEESAVGSSRAHSYSNSILQLIWSLLCTRPKVRAIKTKEWQPKELPWEICLFFSSSAFIPEHSYHTLMNYIVMCSALNICHAVVELNWLHVLLVWTNTLCSFGEKVEYVVIYWQVMRQT